jgi:acetate kinase
VKDAILVLNAGAAVLKFSLYQVKDDDDLCLVVRGDVEGFGSKPRLKAKDRRGIVLVDADITSTSVSFGFTQALTHLIDWVSEEFAGILSLIAVGHRIAHGGLEFTQPTLVNDQVIEKLDKLVRLAPLHQPHNLAALKAVRSLKPDLLQVGCFDTAFHGTREKVTQRFGLPDEFFQRGVRRWGFHGLDYASVVEELHKIAPELAEERVIVARLGRGASMCAVRHGRSVDTTMSFSALDGLPMATRCGSLDPGVVLFLMQSLTLGELQTLLHEQSGLLGISGISGDVRELLASQNPRAAEALEYFVYRAIREIGCLTAALGGLDGLIFTGGIGENCTAIRSRICQGLAWLGIRIDRAANERGRGCISSLGQSPSVWVIASDQDRMIAAGTLAVARALAKGSTRPAAIA